MIRKILVAVLATFLLTGWGEYERVSCLNDQERLPVYKILSDDGSGMSNATAVIVAPGFALTAAHAVDGNLKSVSVLTPEGPRAASRVALDPVNDLALLKLDTIGLEALPFHTATLALGELIWTVGFAGDGGISYKGPVLGISGGHLRVGAPVFPGMSGGAVVVCKDDRPYLAGTISSFNYRITRRYTETAPGKSTVFERTVNDGTSNAPGGQLGFWFTEWAIEEEEKREKEQE